jgi:sulfotransferase family protein
VKWKGAFNAALRRATHYELRRVQSYASRSLWTGKRARRFAQPLPGDRLVTAPAFILCSLRSGSTLLRVLLNSHSQIHAPQEVHLRYVGVTFTSKWVERAMDERNLDITALEYLLWDRILHRDLTNSGKEHIVCKTPNDVFNADRIVECWPDARFIFLLRHPAAIARSRASLRPSVDSEKNTNRIRRYCEAVERARRTYPGHTVRYEDLTADPSTVTQSICEFLGVPWEPQMLEYGRFDHGKYGAGLGDWKQKIKSGSVQPAGELPAPEEIPPSLRGIAEAWGYVPPGGARRVQSPVEAT